MKKTIKITISVLLLAFLSLSLAGCKQLDLLKKNHGVFLDDSREEIQLRGYVYEKVKERVMFGNEEWETFLIADEYAIKVTNKDVPVLLANQNGDTARYNSREEEDPVILSIYDSHDDGKTVEVFYCREDYLDAVKAKIDHVELDHFYYTQMMYSMEENKTIYKKKLVSDEVTEVIKKALERPYDAAIDLDAESGYMDYSQFRDLRCTDKDLLFTNDINMEVCKMSSGEYYVYGVSSKTGSQMPYWKKVAPEDNALLDELFYPDVVETIFPEK